MRYPLSYMFDVGFCSVNCSINYRLLINGAIWTFYSLRPRTHTLPKLNEFELISIYHCSRLNSLKHTAHLATQPAAPHNAAGAPESSAAPPKPPDGITKIAEQTTTLTRVGDLTSTRVVDTTDENSTGIQGDERSLTRGPQDAERTTNPQGGPTLTCRLLVCRVEALRVHLKAQWNLRQNRHHQRH